MCEAYLANVRTVEILASIIQEMEVQPHLIQISTDHLYSGQGPHNEASVMPINAYALTKFAGELVALKAGATVMRTNFFGLSRNDKRISFTDWLYKSMISGVPFTVFEDVMFSALHMRTLIAFVSMVIELRRPGLFNVGSRSGFSKARFAEQFAAELGLDISAMNAGSYKDLQLASPRPNDMRMNVSAFESAFNVEMPDLEDQIREAAEEYGSKT
jgi:dTDP-4-dehydrorhamnose reductase